MVFGILLSSADLVFRKYLNKVLEELSRLSVVEHAVLIAGTALALTGMFAYSFYRDRRAEDGGKPSFDREKFAFRVCQVGGLRHLGRSGLFVLIYIVLSNLLKPVRGILHRFRPRRSFLHRFHGRA